MTEKSEKKKPASYALAMRAITLYEEMARANYPDRYDEFVQLMQDPFEAYDEVLVIALEQAGLDPVNDELEARDQVTLFMMFDAWIHDLDCNMRGDSPKPD